MIAILVLLFLAFSIGSSTPALAQTPDPGEDTRAGTLAAERDSKAENVTPPTRGVVERALYWYDSHGGKLQWRGLHFVTGSFPAGAGTGLGVGLTRRALGSSIVDPAQPNRVDFNLQAARSMPGYQRVAARVDVLNLGGTPIDFTARWQDYEYPQEDFYGFGPDSSESHRTNYRLDGRETALDLRWRPLKELALGSSISWLAPKIGPGTDGRFASTESAFDPSALPGFEGISRFVRNDVTLDYDWRDSTSHPRRGGHYQAAAARYSDRNLGQFDFTRIDISVQQIVPLPNAYRRLELRASAALADAAAGHRVPMIYQPSLGGATTLRGFTDSRFRDRNAVAMSAEYQWEAWWALDAALFVDAGQVMPRLRDFSARDLEVTYGFGLRLHSNNAFLARLDLAFSREGFVPLLRFNYGF